MSRRRDHLLEWITPGRVRRASIPPLEAGFRPNRRLDEGEVLGSFDPGALDDVVVAGESLVIGVGTELLRRTPGGEFTTLVGLPGPVTSMARADEALVVAVSGTGLVLTRPDRAIEILCDDVRVQENVTAITSAPDGSLLVCIGSTQTTDWRWSLVRKGHDGLLLRVAGGEVEVLDQALAWPSGVALDGEDGFLLSLSLGWRIERRSLALPSRGTTMLKNLPGYPGRITRCPDGNGWWVAMPYMRNRATEFLLEDSELTQAMVDGMEPDAWLVPALGTTNVYRAPLQVGQIRVLGEVKPWAPPRSYGLVFRLDRRGHVLGSAHSRSDGHTHGVTGVAVAADGAVVLACAGSGVVVRLGGGR